MISDPLKADFIRNSNAKGIMSMSKDHSTQLWNSVKDSITFLLSVLKCKHTNITPRRRFRYLPQNIYNSPQPRNPAKTHTTSNLPSFLKRKPKFTACNKGFRGYTTLYIQDHSDTYTSSYSFPRASNHRKCYE